MKRVAPIKLLKKTVPFALVALLASCSEKAHNAVYAHEQCHRLVLKDNDTGLSVLGAEDMAKLPGGDLLVTAYDRRSTAQHGVPPEGGVYIVPATQLDQREIKVSSIFDTMPGGLRPHGVDTYIHKDGTTHAAFVNRSYTFQNHDVISTPTIVRFAMANGLVSKPEILEGERYCRANDIVLSIGQKPTVDQEERVYGNINQTPINPQNNKNLNTVGHVTLDRAQCHGLSALLENVRGEKKGAFELLPPSSVGPFIERERTLAFPNGIGIQFKDRPLSDNNFLVVAETRANQLRYFPKTDRRDVVKLDGSPDNLNVGKPGIIQVAVHPSLIKLALYRYGWTSYAPSRIQKVTGTQVLTLFDDPSGRTYSAASIAVQTAGKLVLGSVGDEGLLVCNGRPTS
ncbi:MAG: hypothetical protein ABJK39_09810 [Hyphomicrobiales bacterium]